MTCDGRSLEQLADTVVGLLDAADKRLFIQVMSKVEGVEAFLGGSVGRLIRDDVDDVNKLIAEALMNFAAYVEQASTMRAEAEYTAEHLVGKLLQRLERATTCAVCTAPLTTSIVHRARVGDVENRWHPKCCPGTCGSDDAHHPGYADHADVPARRIDVALEFQSGVH